MFQFDPSLIPSLRTRKALLIIDLQNDFASSTGALPVTEPQGYVARTLDVAAAFRAAGDHDVIWVRSEYDGPRTVENDSILASDLQPPSLSRSGSRLRRLSLDRSDEDDEAFLGAIVNDSAKPACVRPGTEGAKLVPEAAAAVDARDSNLVKTNYSAFASGQLLPLLRTRLATELYVCGALTNISIHATALDAASHGFAMTLVDDCCGYRTLTRHVNAVRNLMRLTGCETMTAQEMLAQFVPASSPGNGSRPPASVRETATTPGGEGRGGADNKFVGSSGGAQREARDVSSSASQPDPSTSTLPQALSKLRLSNDLSPRPAVAKPDSAQRSKTTHRPAKAKEGMDKEGGRSKATEPLPAAKKPTTAGDASSEPLASDEQTNPGSSEAAGEKTGSSAETTLESSGVDPDTDGHPQSLCEGDTTVTPDLLPAALVDGIFETLRAEIKWQRMSHQGGEVPRLVCVQGAVSSDDSVPVYRHPADEAPVLVPFSPTVLQIKEHVEAKVGHDLNHVLVQLYRSGQDYISDHSDKTLDIVKGSYITNVSLGAERTMVFRTKREGKDDEQGEKKQRDIVRAKLPHNSLVKMGLRTNARWTHAVRQDRRADRDRSAPELAFGGARISLTFRRIGTFMDEGGLLIWGQGAKARTRAEARPVKNGASEEAERMIRAFGIENSTAAFDWDAVYGEGFDVLHFKAVPRLWESGNRVRDLCIRLTLGAYGVGYAVGGDERTDEKGAAGDEAKEVRFLDNDAEESEVRGDVAVMLYLETTYGKLSAGKTGQLAKKLTRFQKAMGLLDRWRALGDPKPDLKPLAGELGVFEEWLSGGDYVAGGEAPSIADFALWPVLQAGLAVTGKGLEQGKGNVVLEGMGLGQLGKYYERFSREKFVGRVLDVW